MKLLGKKLESREQENRKRKILRALKTIENEFDAMDKEILKRNATIEAINKARAEHVKHINKLEDENKRLKKELEKVNGDLDEMKRQGD